MRILCSRGTNARTGCFSVLSSTVGNGKEVLLAALTVCLPYIGFPRTLNALSCINEVLPEAKQ